MRCRGKKVFSRTCPASTAVSSSSSDANSGTCFSTSGLHDMGRLSGDPDRVECHRVSRQTIAIGAGQSALEGLDPKTVRQNWIQAGGSCILGRRKPSPRPNGSREAAKECSPGREPWVEGKGKPSPVGVTE